VFTHNDVIMAGGSQRSNSGGGARTTGVQKRNFKSKYRQTKEKQARASTSMQTDPFTTPGIILSPNKSFGPLGKSYKTTLRVAYTIVLNVPAGGGTADAIFSANGIAKPYVSSVTSTTQCYGHDQLVPFFDHYTVIGSKCRVTCVNSYAYGNYIGVGIRDNSTLITSSSATLRAEPGTNLALMAPATGGDCLKEVDMTYSPNRFFGKSKGNIVGESELRGNMGTVASNLDMPEEQAYYYVLASGQWSGDLATPQVVNVQLEYTCVLTEPKTL